MGKKYKKKKSTLIDIIIPVMNRFDLLEKCLDALPDALRPHPYKVYIFDNNSERVVANDFYAGRDLDVTRSMQNIGFPQACNRAFRKGTSPLAFFLNSDVVLEPDSIDKMVRIMDYPDVGVCGMKLVFPSHEEMIDAQIDMRKRPARKLQHIGLVVNIRAQIIHAFMGWDADHPKVNAVSDIWAVTGAALMTRRNLFRQVGMFDEIYGIGTFEDVDYCMKIRELGYNIKVAPNAVGIHYTGATAEQHKIGYPLQENYQKFLLRWKPKLQQTDIEVL